MGTPKQFVGALFRHSIILAGDHLGQDDVIGAIEEVAAIYGHNAPFVARHHPDKRRAIGALGISHPGRSLSEPKSR